MVVMRVVWDMDGVLITGRGTTHMANGYDGDPKYFMQRFVLECGLGGNPLYGIKSEDLERGFAEWENNYNKGPITTIGQLAACLTDLRHKLKVFPSSEQTVYTKNAVLEGLDMRSVKYIARGLPYNTGAEECVGSFHKRGVRQLLFSNSNVSLVDAVAKKFGFDHSEGAGAEIIFPDNSRRDYSSRYFDNPAASLTGRTKLWNKRKAVFRYLRDSAKGFSDVVAIDDTEIEMLTELRSGGARVFGYYNPNDPDMSPADANEMSKRGITVLKDLREFWSACVAS